MPVLFLHIGFSKTSTTTLQRHYFRGFPAYFGNGSEDGVRIRHLLRQGFEAFREDPFLASDSVFSGLEVALDEDGGGNDVLVSDEVLSEWRGSRDRKWPLGALKPDESLDDWPTPHFLAALQNFLARAGYTLKVILVIRRQPDYVASLFAHMAVDGRFGSGIDLQKSLERVVTEIGDSENPWFDFARLGRTVAYAVGEKNLLLLCYEFGPESLATEIASFAGFPPPSRLPQKPHLNVRRVGDALWRVTGPARFVRFRQFVTRTTMKAEDLLKGRAGPKTGAVMRLLRFGQIRDAVDRKLLRLSHPTLGQIEMTAKLRKTLISCYRQSNLEAAADWRLPLEDLGYLSEDIFPPP